MTGQVVHEWAPALQPRLGQDRRGPPAAARCRHLPREGAPSARTAICSRSTSRSAIRHGAMASSRSTGTRTWSGSISGRPTMTSTSGDDGRIYALTHAIRTEVVQGQEHLAPPRIDDYAVALARGQGAEEGLAARRARELALRAPPQHGPLVHRAGQGRLSAYQLDRRARGRRRARAAVPRPARSCCRSARSARIALLDLDREQIVWALRGPWLRQHDAEALANGHLMVFDNEGHAAGDVSRVLEFDPNSHQITWNYAGDPGMLSSAGCARRSLGGQRQHADHRVRRRPAARGDACGRDRVGVCQPGARRRGRAS